MTTYQDPPLQSRRAVRQGERPEAQPSSPFAPPQVPRTAAGAGEPLNYVTQNRPPLPAYDQSAPSGRRALDDENRAVEDENAERSEGATDEQPSAPQGFRPRNYSPEARTAPPAWTPEHDRGLVEYHTQARAEVVAPTPVEPAPAPSEPASGAASLAASLASEPTEHTFTRRELRALREAHGIVPADTSVTPVVPSDTPAADVAVPAPAQPPVAAAEPSVAVAEPSVAPFPVAEPSSTEVEPAPTRRGRRSTEPESAIPALVEPNFTPTPAAPLAPAVEPEQHAVTLPPPPAVRPAPPTDSPFPFSEPTAVAPVAPAPAPVEVPVITGERPVGHWTTQSDLDDRTQVNESTISRRVGAGALTTNALVLPSLPGHDMGTGEVMLTGTVALPSSLAETGAHSAIDESDIDHLLDPGDHQLVHTDSVPISAFKAVSSHTGNRQQLIANGKPNRGNRVLTGLIISAGVMVVVTVTLLVVAVINGGI